MRRWLLIVAVVTLAGCAPKQWHAPPWMSEQEARIAHDECRREAANLVGQSIDNALVALYRGQQCLTAKGFRQE